MALDTPTRDVLRLPRAACGIKPAAPPPVRYTIRATPRIRNVYYCAFPEAALPPEFSKRRPVVVVSYKNSLTGPILVVPITTRPQPDNPWAVRLPRNPTPGETCDVWAICNHLYTVSCTRLTATHRTVPRLTADEFRPIHTKVLNWIPSLEESDDS
jgi:mRNA interferase MazF